MASRPSELAPSEQSGPPWQLEDPALHEHDLVERCRNGDREALTIALSRHIQVLERVISRLVWDKTEVEDVLQQTLTTAIECFPRFRGESALQTWLIGVAIGVSRNSLRQRRRLADQVVSIQGNAPVPVNQVDAEQTLHDRLLLERLHRHLSHLSLKRREVWVLHVLEGRSLREVAELTGANYLTIKSRLFTARSELRRRMDADPALSAWLRGAKL